MKLRRWVPWALVCLVFAAGCGGGGGTEAPFAPGDLDKLAPAVTYTTPLNNSTGFGTNSRLTVTFNEPMRESTLASAISVSDAVTGEAMAVAAVEYDILNSLATVIPRDALPPGRVLQARVSTAATDLAGNGLAADYAWTFTTAGSAAGGAASGADTVAPAVSSYWPGPGAAGIALNARIAMSFSEPMDVASVGNAFSLRAGSAQVPGRIAYVGRVAVFTPDAPLAPNAAYVATLLRTAKDLAGNGMAADLAWAFTTGAAADRSAPGVRSTNPADGATNVPRDTTLSVSFDEPIYPFVYGMIDGVATEVNIDYATLTASVTPTTPLRPAAGYAASVTPRDLAGNVATAPYRWGFVTAP
jgi:hypothetical protein